jgi:hypothetical protein
MIVSHEARVLFVHVQKTGGSVVSQFLLDHLAGAGKLQGLPGAKHATLRAALRHDPGLADYWVAGFVRNPWARLWSWFSMIERRGQGAARSDRVSTRVERNAFWSGVLGDGMDFEEFVMTGPERFRRLRTPQVDYLTTPRRSADFVGRTETFAQDFAAVAERLGIEAERPVERGNAGPRDDYRAHYTPAMRDRVAEVFAADLRAYGYEFD